MWTSNRTGGDNNFSSVSHRRIVIIAFFIELAFSEPMNKICSTVANTATLILLFIASFNRSAALKRWLELLNVDPSILVSDTINAGFYSRADDEFYSCSSIDWDLDLIERSYQWIENLIVFQPELQLWLLAFHDSLLQSGVRPFNGYTLQPSYDTKIDGSTFNSCGHRFSAVDLLNEAIESSIKVAVYATVEQILFSGSENANSMKNAIITMRQ
ncbi:putative (R)-mandelonitrile lyase [Helianthus anomalus]